MFCYRCAQNQPQGVSSRRANTGDLKIGRSLQRASDWEHEDDPATVFPDDLRRAHQSQQHESSRQMRDKKNTRHIVRVIGNNGT
jgi:hypothetical protein